jgi:tetratricopeptide (TPR) repeat protein
VLPTSSPSSKSGSEPWEKRRAACDRLFILLVWVSLLAGCAVMVPGYSVDRSGSLPDRVHLREVPFFSQKAYQCGPAALAATLNWTGLSTNPDALAPLVFTPDRKGSLQTGLITAARRHGRLAYPFTGLDCLLGELSAGRPVIVLQNLGLDWIPKWHYAVAIGYDLDAAYLILHTGLSAQRQVGLKTFMRTWNRSGQWALLTVPATTMPVCAEVSPYLQSVLGLEQAGFDASALAAFDMAANRWPDSVEASMALGNAQYRQNLVQAAITSFRRALVLDPSRGAAMNNLAHLLGEMGELEEAEAMARRAVASGGPHTDIYHRTLEEILLKRQ